MTDECPDITRALARLASFRGTNENDGEKKSRTRLYDTKPQPEKIAAKKNEDLPDLRKKVLERRTGKSCLQQVQERALVEEQRGYGL